MYIWEELGEGEDDQNRMYKMIRWGIEKSEDSLERGVNKEEEGI